MISLVSPTVFLGFRTTAYHGALWTMLRLERGNGTLPYDLMSVSNDTDVLSDPCYRHPFW